MIVNIPLPFGASNQQESPLPFTSALGTPTPPPGAGSSCHAAVGHSPVGGPAAPTDAGQASNDAAPIVPINAPLLLHLIVPPLIQRLDPGPSEPSNRRHLSPPGSGIERR